METHLAETTFGERLMEARRIKGETIEEVSAQLRIRPSIILAMETSNYSHMPHKGYARNMVSSYARYLGLDSTRITEQFLREFRRWEATSKRGSNYNASTLSLASVRGIDPDDPLLDADRKADGRETITAAKRNRDRSSVWGKENTRDTDRTFREQLRQIQDDKGARQSIASRRAPSRVQNGETSHTKQLRTNDYVGKPPRQSLLSGLTGNLSNNPKVLIGILVVVFVAILILWAVIASTCAKNENAQIPLTGVSTSDQGLNVDQATTNPRDVETQITEDNRYGPFELIVEVTGGASWLQVDVDGATPYAEVLNAPWSARFTVSSKAKVEAGAPGNVKVYRNGVEVPLELVNGLGSLVLEVEQRPIVQNAQTADSQN
jgi:hypothetical protein